MATQANNLGAIKIFLSGGEVIMTNVDADSQAVQTYLEFIQSVISRMATNSSGCKTWCITLVSASVVIIADKGKPDYVWIALIPLMLFLFLDCYYLGLERCYRRLYDCFINKLHANKAKSCDLYELTISYQLMNTFKAVFSFSIWPFYGLLSATLIVVRIWIL
jgi:hypothetical protein